MTLVPTGSNGACGGKAQYTDFQFTNCLDAVRRQYTFVFRIDAARALAIGLLQEVVAPSALDQQVDLQLEMLLRAGPVAAAQSKGLLFRVAGLDVTRQLHEDQQNARLIARLRVSAEGQEGLAAFLEKRDPGWVLKNTLRSHD